MEEPETTSLRGTGGQDILSGGPGQTNLYQRTFNSAVTKIVDFDQAIPVIQRTEHERLNLSAVPFGPAGGYFRNSSTANTITYPCHRGFEAAIFRSSDRPGRRQI